MRSVNTSNSIPTICAQSLRTTLNSHRPSSSAHPSSRTLPLSLPLTLLALSLFLGILSSQAKAAYTCNSDCYAEASYRYRCPTLRNPGRKCYGRNPVKLATCESAKAASCKVLKPMVAFFTPKVKPVLQGQFNAGTYQAAAENNSMTEYMGLCSAAAAATCAAIGAEHGGNYGALLSGAGGVFIAYQICRQSAKW